MIEEADFHLDEVEDYENNQRLEKSDKPLNRFGQEPEELTDVIGDSIDIGEFEKIYAQPC